MEEGGVFNSGNRLHYGNLDLDLKSGKIRTNLMLAPNNFETHIRFWLGNRPTRDKFLATTQQLRTFAKENKMIYRTYKKIVK